MGYSVGYPENVLNAVFYNLAPYKNTVVKKSERDRLIYEISENVSIATAPRYNYDMSMAEVQGLVEQIFDKYITVEAN